MGKLIVFSNVKGGVGKSTLAIHLAFSLYFEGYKVAVYDGDQLLGTVMRFFENRTTSPYLLTDSWTESMNHVDFVIIDMPAGKLDQALCSQATYLITPINDSLIDLDQLIHCYCDSGSVLGMLSSAIFDARLLRAQDGKIQSFHWFVVRNRLHHVSANNSRKVAKLLEELQRRAGCIVLDGLSERMIFRELFDRGLTLFDKKEYATSTLSHVAARQEIRNFMYAVINQ